MEGQPREESAEENATGVSPYLRRLFEESSFGSPQARESFTQPPPHLVADILTQIRARAIIAVDIEDSTTKQISDGQHRQEAVRQVIEAQLYRTLQPDVVKWQGVSSTLPAGQIINPVQLHGVCPLDLTVLADRDATQQRHATVRAWDLAALTSVGASPTGPRLWTPIPPDWAHDGDPTISGEQRLEREHIVAGQKFRQALDELNQQLSPVQRWRKEHGSGQPLPLRYDNRLSIRSLERMRTKHWHRAWTTRWDSMLEDPSADRLHYSGSVNPEERPIDAVLSDNRWVGLVLTKTPAPQPERGAVPDELTTALRSGLPVIFWHPNAGPDELHELINWVLDGDGRFLDLPDRRKKANSPTVPFNDSLVRDLVVMWDDPKKVIVLDQPLIPAQQ